MGICKMMALKAGGYRYGYKVVIQMVIQVDIQMILRAVNCICLVLFGVTA